MNTNNTALKKNIDNRSCYDELATVDKEALDKWIKWNYEVTEVPNDAWTWTSYGLKHDFSRESKIYITNSQFKYGMLAAGFTASDKSELSWRYKMKVRIHEGFFKWCLNHYQFSRNQLGDFTRDMMTDYKFPREADNKEEISDYLRRRGASEEARKVFVKLWVRYEGWKVEEKEKAESTIVADSLSTKVIQD